MTVRVSDTIAAIRDLGLTCRYDYSTGEYRVAFLTSHYRHYPRKEQLALQELHACYTNDGLDAIGTARMMLQASAA